MTTQHQPQAHAVSTQVQVTPVFDWNMSSRKRFTINQGGSSSGKTYAILQALVMLAREIPERAENKIITVTGESLPSLKVGALRDFETIISKRPFRDYIYKANRGSPITFKLWNGAIIEFKTFRDVEAAKHGKRRILFINEANNIPYTIAKQLILRSSRVFIDFNPSADFWAHEHYLAHPDALWLYSTYRDNPFADADMVADIEGLREVDPELYKVYGLGRRGNLVGQVFPNIIWAPGLPEYMSNTTYFLDPGFTNSFTACGLIGRADRRIWGHELFYEKGLTDPQILERIKEVGIPKSADLIVDSADQKLIAFLQQSDYNAIACKKRNVEEEVQMMKRFQWSITDGSRNWKKEAKNYRFKQNSDGTFTNKPIDAFNHLWDGARYALLHMENPSALPYFVR